MDIIKREQDFNVSLDYLSENEFFNDEKECRFYMETKLIQYIHNYITNEVTELEELMEIKQLIQRQKLERMIKAAPWCAPPPRPDPGSGRQSW